MARGGENNRTGMMRSMNSTGVPMEGVKFTSQDGGNNRVRLGDISNVVGHARKMDEKNPQGFVGRRPMTRKFAASLAGKSQDMIAGEGHKKPNSEISGSNCSNAVELDGYESDYDFPLAMIEEIEDMVNIEHEEVEMEDLEMDIDSCDSKDPLAVVDYVDDIYRFFRRTEDLGCVSPNYMATQFDINEKMRGILIDWLIEVHYKFELMEETLFLTVNIIDRFLARQTVARKKLQLVGVTALLLACKYEEVSIPVIDDLIVISDRAYTRAEVLEMEKLIVNTLHFNMSVPTPYVFMRRFLKAAKADKKLELLSLFMIELCLVEYEMLKFRPSFLAAAAVYTAQCTLKGPKNWTRTSELHTTYSEEHLLECSRMMVGFHTKAGTQKLTSVHRKYDTLKSGYTARTEPALFLLDEGHCL